MNILITGAGGPAAISFFNAIQGNFTGTIFMADMNRHSSGLYLVPKPQRILVPAGDDPEFPHALFIYCVNHDIDLVIPTVDSELAPLAAMQAQFKQHGVRLALSPEPTLLTCFDKYKLMQALEEKITLAPYALFDDNFNADDFGLPLIVKPRSGSGSRDVHLIRNARELINIPRDGSFMVQTYLPGEEYSVDVFADEQGQVIASVVRERIKIDSGIAVIGKTVINRKLSQLAKEIATLVGIRYTANIQFKLDQQQLPKLLEINPRFPGTMPLTVAAGVNMPLLCISQAKGETLPEWLSYRPVAMARHWQETFFNAEEFNAIETIYAPSIIR